MSDPDAADRHKCCSRCKTWKDRVTCFGPNSGKKDGLQSRCCQCIREHQEELKRRRLDERPAQAPMEKRCTKCGKTRTEGAEFIKHSRNKDGLETQCSDCRKERARRWRQNNPEKYEAQWKSRADRRIMDGHDPVSPAKRCTKCDRGFAEGAEFGMHKGHHDGFNSVCKDCCHAQQQVYRDANREYLRRRALERYYRDQQKEAARSREYRRQNAERIQARQRELRRDPDFRRKERDRERRWRQKNRDRYLQARREWRGRNAEKVNRKNCEAYHRDLETRRRQQREYRRRNAARIRERQCRYRRENADRINELRRQRRQAEPTRTREAQKAYYQRHKERMRRQARERRRRNPERSRTLQRRWYWQNHEHVLKRNRQYRLLHAFKRDPGNRRPGRTVSLDEVRFDRGDSRLERTASRDAPDPVTFTVSRQARSAAVAWLHTSLSDEEREVIYAYADNGFDPSGVAEMLHTSVEHVLSTLQRVWERDPRYKRSKNSSRSVSVNELNEQHKRKYSRQARGRPSAGHERDVFRQRGWLVGAHASGTPHQDVGRDTPDTHQAQHRLLLL